MDKYWDSLTESLWAPESWLKVVVLLVFYPVWLPVLRAMRDEVQEVLAPEGGLYANKEPRPIAERAPGTDPFLNIPLASHRRRMGTAATPPAGAQGTANASGGAQGSARGGPAANRESRGTGRPVHDVNARSGGRRRGF